MALEFRTRDENYRGPKLVPSRTIIEKAGVFVDHLPPGFPTEPYNPHLVSDPYSRRPRYIIDANILVDTDSLTLVGIPHSGRHSVDSEVVQLVTYNSIERYGVELLLSHHNHTSQGTLYPIPEPRAEPLPPHLAKHRHRRP
jgi:hypothetical protein